MLHRLGAHPKSVDSLERFSDGGGVDDMQLLRDRGIRRRRHATCDQKVVCLESTRRQRSALRIYKLIDSVTCRASIAGDCTYSYGRVVEHKIGRTAARCTCRRKACDWDRSPSKDRWSMGGVERSRQGVDHRRFGFHYIAHSRQVIDQGKRSVAGSWRYVWLSI